MVWANTVGEVHTTAVTLAGVWYGIARLPEERRRYGLERTASSVFADFGNRILPFDSAAARAYADVAADRERLGRPIGTADAQIAAICRALDAAVATRNVTDFEGIGIEIVDPWVSQG